MTQIKKFFTKRQNIPAKIAIFMSGSGTNAEQVLEKWLQEGKHCAYEPVCIVTDRPKKSRTLEISKKFQIPMLAEDIFEFYKKHGHDSIALKNNARFQIRELWTERLRDLLKPFQIDFAVFAGFVPLSNITNDFPCLNVHPGDLSIEKNGQRLLVGLHTLPIQEAILAGYEQLSSSVIIASKVGGGGDGMDSGLILGISEPVDVEWNKKTPDYYLELFHSRKKPRPKGGYKDEFQDLLNRNLEILKENGDWIVFPNVIADFAKGKFGYSADGSLVVCNQEDSYLNMSYIVYGKTTKEIVL